MFLLVALVSCKTESKIEHPEEFDEDVTESAGFVRNSGKKTSPKTPFTARLVKSVDKAIAENFEENVLTSWLSSDDGQKTVVNAADMLTSYVNRNFGLADEDEAEDEFSMKDLIGEFFKSQQKKKVKKPSRRVNRRARKASNQANVDAM